MLFVVLLFTPVSLVNRYSKRGMHKSANTTSETWNKCVEKKRCDMIINTRQCETRILMRTVGDRYIVYKPKRVLFY